MLTWKQEGQMEDVGITLTVYDGPDTTFPVLALTLCGEESGDGGQAGEPGSVLSIGDSFTSSDESGALTFVFLQMEVYKKQDGLQM